MNQRGFRPLAIVARAVVLLGVLGGLASVTLADQVLMQDGSVLNGTVERVANGVVLLKTEFAGDLRLDVAKVKGISTDKAMSVQTKAGQTTVGQLSYSAEGGQTVAGGATALEEVTAVWSEAAPNLSPEALPKEHQSKAAPLVAAHQKQLTELQAKQREEEAALLKTPTESDYWSGTFQVGITGKGGNTDAFSFIARVETNRVDPDDRLKLYAQALYSTTEGDNTTNEIIAGTQIEHDLNPKWFLWGKGEIEHDPIEDLDLRLTVTGGIGRWWIREEKQDLKTRFGVGYQHQSYGDGTNTDDMILDVGVDYRLTITKWLEVKHTTDWYPTVDDPLQDWRLVSETAGEVPLNPAKTWKVRAGIRFDYNNNPPDDVDSRLDTTYFTNLVYEWK
jgi:putative salt-induced outer membrane protein YdiY